jgi:hypothetical protein
MLLCCGLAHQCVLRTSRKPALGFHSDALLFRLLVALLGGRDLLLCAKHLFGAARTTWSSTKDGGAGWGSGLSQAVRAARVG